MAKSLQTLLLGALLLAMPLGVAAQPEHEETKMEIPAATLTVKGNIVHISGAEGKVLKVYNLTGTEVGHHRIEGNDVQINLSNLPKGYYIIKVDKVVRKISVR